jgi:hypothetical protein
MEKNDGGRTNDLRKSLAWQRESQELENEDLGT